ncbi:MAG: head decoration protein, partial [Nitrospinales bacterium]
GGTLTGGLGSSTDGTQEAFGVLGQGVTAPDGIDVDSFAIVRDAVISKSGIVWAVGVLDSEKDIALAELEKKGIASRSAA